MSNQEVKLSISEYVQDVTLGVLAYVREDLTPMQRTFGAFAVNGNDILLATQKRAAKVAEITAHPRVSFFLEKKNQELRDWKSALYVGVAAPITGDEELRLAVELISARSAFVKAALEREGLNNFVLFRLQTREVEWLDYTKGFGHVDRVFIEEGASDSNGRSTTAKA